ncbi:MAG: aminotransferase class I/II-fold pyridoxal phosphate-dependent enzyme [Oscillospiraceae bacterium]
MFTISEKIRQASEQAEISAKDSFAKIDDILACNTEKVLYAFAKNKVSEACFKGSTGYGYDDLGRDVLDDVYADIFKAEDALVRHNFVSGTHALTVALFGLLRTGDTLLCITGSPYDTLEEVIGIRGEKGNGSLSDFGVKYDKVDLKEDGSFDKEKILEKLSGAKVVYIQRSRGYSLRPAITISQMEEIIKACKEKNPDIIVMVDNCYGEFVEKREPTEVGADICVGSLIKNAGGGIAETGGYIVGKKRYVELCAYRLTCVGMGKEVGCTLNQSRGMFMGIFLAPQTTASAVKTATFASELFTSFGFEALPGKDETRSDIVTVIKLGNEERLTAFCEGIQSGAPVDAFVTPVAWDMPGYESKVIMAAGAFTGGASIELSADAPIREPFAVYMQGGLTYHSGKIGVMLAAERMSQKGLL